jgi:hypothetical protein
MATQSDSKSTILVPSQGDAAASVEVNPISRWRLLLAMTVAIISDGVSVVTVLLPPLQVFVDKPCQLAVPTTICAWSHGAGACLQIESLLGMCCRRISLHWV